MTCSNPPTCCFGTDAQIAEHLIRVHEETGASYISVFPHLKDALQPDLGVLTGHVGRDRVTTRSEGC
jgi:hypothetical protein